MAANSPSLRLKEDGASATWEYNSEALAEIDPVAWKQVVTRVSEREENEALIAYIRRMHRKIKVENQEKDRPAQGHEPTISAEQARLFCCCIEAATAYYVKEQNNIAAYQKWAEAFNNTYCSLCDDASSPKLTDYLSLQYKELIARTKESVVLTRIADIKRMVIKLNTKDPEQYIDGITKKSLAMPVDEAIKYLDNIYVVIMKRSTANAVQQKGGTHWLK
jgi:hypothetical protein